LTVRGVDTVYKRIYAFKSELVIIQRIPRYTTATMTMH